MAVGFIRANRPALTRPLVSGVSGQCRLSTSLCRNRVSRSTNSTPASGRRVRLCTITCIPNARARSALKRARVAASKLLTGPQSRFSGDRAAFVEDIRRALLASKIVSYAQGFMLMMEASREYKWNLNYRGVALVWRGGCIIRSAFLGQIKAAFDKNPNLENLLLDDYFREVIEKCQESWRRAVIKAVELGIAVPAFATALAFYDGYRSERLPANLLQAQRDYFGAHTYERVDQPRGKFFHIDWPENPRPQIATN